MSIFSRFPYSDFHRLNADWILEKLKEMIGLTEDAAEAAQEAAETVAGYDERLTAVEADAAGAVRFDESQTLNTTQKTQARNNIGAASASALETLDDVVWTQGSSITALQAGSVRADQVQSFSDAQKLQARTNIGAAASADIPADYVAYTAQSLTNDQKTQARNNISAAPSTMPGAVRYDATQSLSADQKTQARNNIGAASVDAALSGAVLYSSAQLLSTAEKAQARSNIGSPASDDVLPATNPVSNVSLGIMDDSVAGNDGDEITATLTSLANHSILRLEGDQSNTVRLAGLAAPDEDDEAVNLGYADTRYGPIWNVQSVTGTTPSITPADHTIFEAGEVSSLTVSTPLAEQFVIIFDSGSTPATLSLPATINMPADFQVNANTHYEINIRKTWGLYAAWEVTP